MARLLALLLALATLVACATPATAPPMSGEQAYRSACARCHDDGVGGAPRVGDTDAWTGRSWLWQAVLSEHAKQGYGAMPARGSAAGLDNAAVEKAVEYMLDRTMGAPAAE